MPRALGGTSASMRSPPMKISPELGRSSPAIMRSRVVLPHPDGPSNTSSSPSRMDRSTPSTARESPNRLLRSRSSTPTTLGSPPPPPPPAPPPPPRFLPAAPAHHGQGA